jgi:hypothetical protein
MGKPFGNPEEFEFAVAIAGFEIEGSPATEVGRVAAEIDGDVPDVTREDADELSLRMAELIVETAEDATCGKRLVVLGEDRREAECRKSIHIENFGEPTASVAVTRGLQDFYIAQGGIT